MAKDADKLNKKLRLLEEQHHGDVKQTETVSTVITRGSANRDKSNQNGDNSSQELCSGYLE